MSGGKNRAKNDLIFELRSARTCEKLFQNIDVFFAFCLVKTLQVPVFLAVLLWELEVVKKTPVFAIHVTRKKQCFLRIH